MSDLSSFLSSTNKSGWSAKLWDGFIEAVQARLAPLEENLGIQREITDAIIARGLTVIEQELAPIVRQAEALLGETGANIDSKLQRFEHKVTGGTVIALSSTPSQLREGEDIGIYLDAVDREFFAPTPYISISRASTVANWAIAKVKSFQRATGLLVATLEKVENPGGPYNDWVLTSLPGATFLQKYYYEQTIALRQAVGRDKDDTKADRQAVSTMRDEAQTARAGAVAARSGSEQVLADLRKAVAPPITTPSNPVEGQLWWDGTIMRVYQSGVGYVPTVTVSIGGRRYEKGVFGANADGVITVGGGFTAALVFVNGELLDEGTHYTAASPTITVHTPIEGDRFFVEAYLSTSAVDYYTKEQVDNRIGRPDGIASLDSTGKVPPAQLPVLTTTVTVGAAVAGANGQASIADGDSFTGVLAGTGTLVRWTWGNIVTWLRSIFISKAGDTLTGSLGGVSVSGGRSSFWGNAEGGGYAQMWTRGAPFYSSVSLSGSSYAPVIAEKYGNPGWGGIWSAGVLNYSNGAAAGFAIHHLNSSGNENVAFEFRADGTLRLPGAVYKGTATAAYGDGGTYWMHITGNAGYAASAGNANTVGGWSQGTIADQDNWRVTDTRFAGYVEHAMDRDTGWHAPSGYVFTYAYRKGGDQYFFGARQPQIYIPNAGWRALGGW